MQVEERQIKLLELPGGCVPFLDWLDGLDRSIRVRILRRVGRLRMGNFGDWKAIGSGLSELRLDFGAGYRVYYATHGDNIVILIGGSDKKTQQSAIETAHELWSRFKDETQRFQKHFTR